MHDSICSLGCATNKGRLEDATKNCPLNRIIGKKIPTILALLPIRDKFTAHRQQDYPYKDDLGSLGFSSHKLFVGFAWRIDAISGKIQYNFPTKKRYKVLNFCDSVKGVEYLGENNNVIRFILTDVHPIILNEIVDLMEYFLNNNKSK